MWVHALAEADAGCGGKAVALARLIAAGLPVPDGFVIDARAFRHAAGELEAEAPAAGGHSHSVIDRFASGPPENDPPRNEVPTRSGRTEIERFAAGLAEAAARVEAGELPGELVAAVADRAARLGPRVAVRSSATIEDGDAGAAAGVFSSRTAVPTGDPWPAIRAVWASALTPLAVAYARLRAGAAPGGGGTADPGEPIAAIAVIVQRFVAGERATIYTRPPGAPGDDAVWLQRAGEVERLPRDAGHPLIGLALAAERAIAASGGADVELIVAADRAWLVQARPIVHPVGHVRTPPPPAVLAALDDGRRWTWDVAHNPDPLSPAQTGLVERVERARLSPWSLRVCAGYLYSAPRDEPGAPRPIDPGSRDELAARGAAIEHALAAALAGDGEDARDPAGALDAAIARYLAFYRIWAGELAPLIAAARAAHGAHASAHGATASAHGAHASARGHRPSAVEATLLAAARGELDDDAVHARLGALAPAWDVAAPTFAERPGLLRDAIARARGVLAGRADAPDDPARLAALAADLADAPDDPAHLAALAADLADAPVDPADLAALAADLAERDDAWFARAQWEVRRAILARAAELGLAPDDACWLPLDDLIAGHALDPDDARRRASGARAAAARAARWTMPIVVGGPPPEAGRSLHGIGTGARVSGRVVRFASLASAIAVGPSDVVVTRAVTPALAVLVVGCAALVSETGGALDHGAALARELGIPCVVGCRDAWLVLAEGMIVTVDGDAGTVTPRSATSAMPTTATDSTI